MEGENNVQPIGQNGVNIPQAPQQPIQILQPLKTPQQNESNNRTKFLIVISILIIVLLISSLTAYLFLFSGSSKNKLVDDTYGFTFSNINGWKPLPPQNNSYLYLASFNNVNENVSQLSLTVFPIQFKNLQDFKDSSQKGCNEFAEFNKAKPNLTTFQSNNLTGYVCEIEQINYKTNIWQKVRNYSLYGPTKKYLYSFNVAFPSDNSAELQKINLLISGFKVTK